MSGDTLDEIRRSKPLLKVYLNSAVVHAVVHKGGTMADCVVALFDENEHLKKQLVRYLENSGGPPTIERNPEASANEFTFDSYLQARNALPQGW